MQVFISHSWESAEQARELAEFLEANGYDVHLPANGVAGNWPDALRGALAGVGAVIVLVSADSTTEQRRQWRLAMETLWDDPTLRVVPVVLEDAQLPGWLRGIQAVRHRPGGPSTWQAVLEAIKRPTQRVQVPRDEWRAQLDEVVRSAERLESEAG